MTDRGTDPLQPSDNTPSVSLHIDIAADVDRVWDALVTDGGLGSWMGDGATLEPRPGGSLSFPDPVGGQHRDGRVTTVADQERLEYTWWTTDRPTVRSSVTITLDRTDTGTRVTVVETAAPRSPVGFTVPSAQLGAGRSGVVSAVAGGGPQARRVAAQAMTRSFSLIGLWSWRLAMVTMASQMVRV